MQPKSKAFYNDFNLLKQSLEEKFRQGMMDKSNLAGIYPSLMSGRRYKKLDVLFEFSNSIL